MHESSSPETPGKWILQKNLKSNMPNVDVKSDGIVLYNGIIK